MLLQTGSTVSRSTVARWVAENNLGYKLPGNKGQWIVDGMLREGANRVKARQVRIGSKTE